MRVIWWISKSPFINWHPCGLVIVESSHNRHSILFSTGECPDLFWSVIAHSHPYPLIWQPMNPCDIPWANHDLQVSSNQWMIDVRALLRNWNTPTSMIPCVSAWEFVLQFIRPIEQESKYFFLRCSSALVMYEADVDINMGCDGFNIWNAGIHWFQSRKLRGVWCADAGYLMKLKLILVIFMTCGLFAVRIIGRKLWYAHCRRVFLLVEQYTDVH